MYIKQYLLCLPSTPPSPKHNLVLGVVLVLLDPALLLALLVVTPLPLDDLLPVPLVLLAPLPQDVLPRLVVILPRLGLPRKFRIDCLQSPAN